MSTMTMPVDAAASARRILLVYRHSPGLLLSSLAVPVAMVGVFGYVFGSAMNVPGGGDYREFLMPGLFAMVALNAVMPAMVGGARDAGRGVTDRLRSMSVSRLGLLTGQALADLLVAAVVLVPTALVGLAAGWRIRHGLGPRSARSDCCCCSGSPAAGSAPRSAWPSARRRRPVNSPSWPSRCRC
ncbi:ABC transporter permease [Kitasatospora cheerisanensis]|uniref:Multidrug ABC transporter permease n=1 Tax=Kitasatospora cheerisanensis KCTC 2395 TaxID=1348663 RepID=A0A066YZC6_9ACTN|nr:multidrug ABC transporter permease [Kitasatospora cheerisanensis KCTC 2395]